MKFTEQRELLSEIARRVDRCPSVVRRSGGLAGSVATYLPGERLVGVRRRDEGDIEVRVVMSWESTVDQVEREVLEAIRSASPGTSLDVDLVIDDIADPPPALMPSDPESAGEAMLVRASGPD